MFNLIFRNLWKNAHFSAINIFGLSVSLAVCMLIGLYLHFEFTFDRTHPAYQQMYRLNTTFKYPNSPESVRARSSIMMGPYLLRECRAIEGYLRVVEAVENKLLRTGRRDATIGKSYAVDTSFFSFFRYPLLWGDPATAFSRPENIVLARPVSEMLFGTESPIGKTIENTYTLPDGKDTTILYTVSGVLATLPHNSHLHFDALFPLDTRQYDAWDSGNRWHAVVTSTYFRLHPSVQNGWALEPTLAEALKKEMPNSEMIALTMQPFKDIHLNSTHLFDENNYLQSNQKYVSVLGMVALFILFISSVNFANLSTVLALKRGQEVGVRKSLGASQGNIFRSFLIESSAMAFLAGGLGLLWACLLRVPFLQMLGRDFDLPFPTPLLLGFAGMVILLGLISGVYPAIEAARHGVLTAFQRHHKAISTKHPFVQRLVVAQFALSGMLIIGSLICYQQLNFLKTKDLGFQYAQVIEINLGFDNWMHANALKNDLAAIPGVEAVGSSDNSLGSIEAQNGVFVRNVETRQWENYPMNIIRADRAYFDLYEMKFATGSAPTREGALSELEYVVNESFVKKMGWKDDPIGKEIMRATYGNPTPGKVVGVIKDIHHNTLHHAINPICMQASEANTVISIKADPARMHEVLERTRAVWMQYIKDRPFDYQFMDDHFAQMYESENRLAQVLFFATLLSICIACLGLLALSAFVVSQRTKEIGIRKVLGASVANVTGLLAKDFLKLVVIAIVIASPVAYYFMQQWLADFAYRIDMQWWMFVVAGLLAVVIALLTVGGQAMKAALVNPVKSLKSE
jgi:putative ABC transport system permease protein